MPLNVIIATDDGANLQTDSLTILTEALRNEGISVSSRDWQTTPAEQFASADAVLPICVWDHKKNAKHFESWMRNVCNEDVFFLNETAVLYRNLDKNYLLDLIQDGFPVIDTWKLKNPNRQDIAELMTIQGWPEVVIKPTTGQDGHEILRLKFSDRNSWPALVFSTKEVLIQPFLPEIEEAGETCLVFIDERFSHAINRVTAPGKSPVNQQFGVTSVETNVSDKIIEFGEQILSAYARRTLYARVDGVVLQNGFLVMEVEAIAPYLYLEFAPKETAMRFANAIKRKVAGYQ